GAGFVPYGGKVIDTGSGASRRPCPAWPAHQNPASPAQDARQDRATAARTPPRRGKDGKERTHLEGTARTSRLDDKLSVGFGSAGEHYRQLPSCSTYACPVTGLPWYRPVTLLAPSKMPPLAWISCPCGWATTVRLASSAGMLTIHRVPYRFPVVGLVQKPEVPSASGLTATISSVPSGCSTVA